MLDLFCCEGGAAAGYTAAGFDVHGVDRENVAGRYLRSGASGFTRGDATTHPLDGYDAVHASPPCKDHTDLAAQSGGDGTGWMLAHTIDRLRAWGARTGRPWVVENVVSQSTRAVMDGAIMLCGSMFDIKVPGTSFRSRGVVTHVPRWRHLQRHRLFVSNVPMLTPPDQCSGRPIIGVYGTGGGGQMTRGYKATAEQARTLMGMPWASRNGCAQAIPVDYAQWLGEQIMPAAVAR